MKIKKILMGVFALTLSVVGLVAGTHTVNAESTTLKMTDSGWWCKEFNQTMEIIIVGI